MMPDAQRMSRRSKGANLKDSLYHKCTDPHLTDKPTTALILLVMDFG